MSRVTCRVSRVTKISGPIIRIGRESQCLPYAGFFVNKSLISKELATLVSHVKLRKGCAVAVALPMTRFGPKSHQGTSAIGD